MSDTALPHPGATTTVPPVPATPASVAAATAGTYPEAVTDADAASSAVPARPRWRRPGVLAALIGGAALLLALVFGGGMAAGWALSQAQAPTSFQPGEFPGGGNPGFGPGSGSGEQGTVPTRPDDSSEDGTSSGDAS